MPFFRQNEWEVGELLSVGSDMCGGIRGVDFPMYDDLFSTLVSCVFQWGLLACVSRSFMVRVEFGRWSNFSCIVVLGVMFGIFVFLCVPLSRMGGRLR